MFMRIDFPSGRCYAAQSFNPSLPEWPPHPSRLMSALVASAYRSDEGMTPSKRSALLWLEGQSAPVINAPKADSIAAPISYVPPGDSSGSKGAGDEKQFEHGVHRWRQPRHFPYSIILGDPVLYYGWDSDPDSQTFEALSTISAGVTHIGTSHSMALASIHPGEMPAKPTLIPDTNGTEYLRSTKTGRLDELDSIYQRRSGLRRPTATCEILVPYKQTATTQIEAATTPKYEFVPLRISGTMHGADTAAYLARAVRRAVMSILGDKAPPAVHGHNGGEHIAWLPLPDVGHSYANGRVVGLGVGIPYTLNPGESQQIMSGLGQLHEVRLPDGRIVKISPVAPGEPIPVALKSKTWTKGSDVWSTVTPVVIDRPPKKLAQNRLIKALSQSLEMAGYNKPIEVEVSAYSAFKGAPPAFRIPFNRPRYHATIRFKEPVTGPVIAGRLRYFGIGLFRPFA